MSGFVGLLPSRDEEADLRNVEEVYVRNGEFLIGLLGGRVVGMGGFKRGLETTAELKRIRIDPDEQGKGYGTRLLRELEKRAVGAGITKLCLETAKARPLTLAFYDKHGYERVGKGFYGEVEIVKFAKHLDIAP